MKVGIVLTLLLNGLMLIHVNGNIDIKKLDKKDDIFNSKLGESLTDNIINRPHIRKGGQILNVLDDNEKLDRLFKREDFNNIPEDVTDSQIEHNDDSIDDDPVDAKPVIKNVFGGNKAIPIQKKGDHRMRSKNNLLNNQRIMENSKNANADPLDIAAENILENNHNHPNYLNPNDPNLTDEQKKFAKEHQGHEQKHAIMSLILFFSLIVSQLLIMGWQKFYPASYSLCSLIGFWLIPGILGIYAKNTRYVIIWTIFSIINLFVISRALQKPISRNAPRLVYGWYTWIHRITSPIAIFGSILFFCGFFHLGLLFGLMSIEADRAFQDWALLVMFYGIYFGTLGRDCVERLSERMATTLGYYSKGGIPEKYLRHGTCAICGLSTGQIMNAQQNNNDYNNGHIDESTKLYSSDSSNNNSNVDGTVLRLGCGHTYHEFCIRGWTIIGKKDVCPYCGEKVDLTQFKKNPWEITQLLYLKFLDWVRFLLVWNPLVFIFVHFLFKLLDLN